MNNNNNNFSIIIRSFLSHDGVIGSKERWWTGKKEFDFLIDNENEEVISFFFLSFLLMNS